ncbi:gliding motility lipoprotein GldD [Prolixibacter sp. SD074]|jgi:gliding motility-associated lipoprotein GldD|nr:gliding motility lipoprotein GldD [Prolixibacter sp. SD074]
MNKDLPYTFKIPDYSNVSKDSDYQAKRYWINVDVPSNKSSIHISYKAIRGNLAKYTEESRMLAYKHAQKASAIDEKIYVNRAKKVFGTLYNIKGNVASPMQFYLTDSTRHFIRGALYIREIPNIDSLQPVINFLEQDVLQLVESTEWKDVK